MVVLVPLSGLGLAVLIVKVVWFAVSVTTEVVVALLGRDVFRASVVGAIEVVPPVSFDTVVKVPVLLSGLVL